ncbi:hypothetical protein HP456_00085 [Bacillus haikouensis]|jgi:hypothetical protein|uniref:hypothetical protein n=1 Tax=Bacillus haikouensis TaxID=1510468 RepID=UPI0015566F6B|nr:hypothetical protein [Bacillus haikouensis]NQD64320.1 hypothetical protein [Bacillus haikouensis]
MSNIQNLLREGFQQLDIQNEEQIKKEMENTTDENELKRLRLKLEDVRKRQGKKEEKQADSQAEAMAKRMKQFQENDKIKSNIKRQVLDRKTGRWVTVDENNIHHKK